MRPYLILDTYLEEKGAADDFRALVGERPTEAVRPPRGEKIPRRVGEYAGLLLTGSAASVTDSTLEWLEPLRDLVREALERSQPVLGICFGHQLLAQAACGENAARNSPTPELGWEEIEVTTDQPLMVGIDRRFSCFVSHFDEVHVPDGELDVFARSDRCAIHGFQVPDRPAFGVQFHPEMPPEECRRLVRKNLVRIDPQADPEAAIEREVDRRPLGQTIMENFCRLTGE